MVRKIGTVDYANQLSVIKGATIGAMASLLSELARRAVPTFLAQVEKYSHGKANRSEEHTSELQSLRHLVCRLLLEKKNKVKKQTRTASIKDKKKKHRHTQPVSNETNTTSAKN